MKYRKNIALLAAITALFVACGGGEGDSSGSSATRPSDFNSLNQCIVNRWVMGGEQIMKGLDAVGDGTNSVTGNNTSEFSANGAYKGTPAYTINFTSRGIRGTSTYAGTAQGSWSLVDDRLTITRTSSSVTVTNNVGGITTSYTSPFGTPSTVKVISCTPATLTYDQTLSTGAVVRIVLVSA